MQLMDDRDIHADRTGETDRAQIGSGEDPPGGRGISVTEFMSISTGIGTGVGTSIAISSGEVAGAAWTAVGTGVSAGLGASAVGGWEIGKLVNNSQWWQTFIQGKLDKMLGTPDANDPFIGHLVPPIGGVGDWHLELAPQGTTHDQDAWCSCPNQAKRSPSSTTVHSKP